jgi:methylamine--corrinoid protein Co-methyltransferase
MKRIDFAEIMERFASGQAMTEQEFDLKLFKTVEHLKAKHDIKYDPGNPVPLDSGLADRCFDAARELYGEVGTYCLDTQRVARFSYDEMDHALEEAPKSTQWGQGKDQVAVQSRGVGGDTPVWVWGGLQTLLFSDEDVALRMYRACCRSPAVAGVIGGVVPRIDGGKELKADSPLEIYPYRRSAVLLRKAAQEAGRPGMGVNNGAPKAVAHIAMYAGDDGFRKSDGIGTGGVPELKTTFDRLNRVSFALSTGTRISAGLGAMIGGFSGSVEGAAVVAAAGVYQSLLVNHAEVAMLSATPIRIQSRATRNGIWVSSLALQAIGRNSNVILACANGDHPAAGPGTDQYFYETAAGAISGVVCGGHSWGATRKFKIGQTLDFGTPVESEFLGRVCQAAVGLDVHHANRVVVALLEKYENALENPPEGAVLRELYDLAAEQPKKEYRKIYDRVAGELTNLGVPIDPYRSTAGSIE